MPRASRSLSAYDHFAAMVFAQLCAHLLIAIAQQRCHLPQTLYQILQVVSVSAFEKVPLPELFTNYHIDETEKHIPIQLEISGF